MNKFKQMFRKGSRKRQNPDGEPAAELAAEAEPEDDSFTVLDPDDSHATTEVKERQVALRPELKKQISSSEFVCGCCYELLIQPTTLTCGHSFCRLCLANWYGTSNKRECPECRQVWQGLPQVNFLLRSMIEKLFPAEVAKREEDTLNSEAKKIISNFDKQMAANNTSPGGTPRAGHINLAQQRGNHFYLGLGVIVGVIAIVMFSYVWDYVFVREATLLTRPVSRWSDQDVAQWLEELGPWAVEHVGPVFQEKQIDGVQMLVLSDDDIEQLPGLTELQRKAFSMELYAIREHGMKAPYTVAEFRDRHLEKSSLYLQAMPRYPRLALLWVLLFDYTDSFLPLIHVTESVLPDMHEINLYTYPLPGPTLRQWVCFIVKWIMLPYVPCIQLVWHVGNWYLVFVMLVYCGSLTITDVLCWYKIFKRVQGQELPKPMKFVGGILGIFFIICVTPSFLLRFHFNVMVNIMPFYYMYQAYLDLQTQL